MVCSLREASESANTADTAETEETEQTGETVESVSPGLQRCSNPVYQQRPQPESCPEFIEQHFEQTLATTELRQSSSELLSLRALSLIDKQEMNRQKRESKFSNTSSKNSAKNSEKSSETSDNASISYKQSEFMSPTSGEEPYIGINANIRALESDDTSYAKAIRHNYHKHNANDMSSCDDDDTDRSRGLYPNPQRMDRANELIMSYRLPRQALI